MVLFDNTHIRPERGGGIENDASVREHDRDQRDHAEGFRGASDSDGMLHDVPPHRRNHFDLESAPVSRR